MGIVLNNAALTSNAWFLLQEVNVQINNPDIMIVTANFDGLVKTKFVQNDVC